MKLRVLLADDHSLFRKALRMALEMDPDIEIVAEVVDGQGALERVGQTCPDVACLDINMPGMNGIEATRQILALHPEVKIIGLSADTDALSAAAMFEAGALGYVVKSGTCGELLQAIRMVSRNQRYISAEVSLGPDSPGSMLRGAAAMEISPREQQVLQLLARGCDPLQIAEQLSMAAYTVEALQRIIMRKLDIADVAGLAEYAKRTCVATK